jgi:hypothetical protein
MAQPGSQEVQRKTSSQCLPINSAADVPKIRSAD